MNIVPIRNKVVLVRLKNSNTTASGIIIEGMLEEAPRGKVIAIGSEVTDVKVGDVVLVDWNKSTNASVDGIALFVVKQEDIIAVLDEE